MREGGVLEIRELLMEGSVVLSIYGDFKGDLPWRRLLYWARQKEIVKSERAREREERKRSQTAGA